LFFWNAGFVDFAYKINKTGVPKIFILLPQAGEYL
jgi:hypothetical protein